MGNFLPGTIMGFREGLEAFLIISIILRYITKIDKAIYRKYILYGVIFGTIASVVFGGILSVVSASLNNTGEVAKLWESVASIIALALVTSFIVWMIKRGSNMTGEIEGKVEANLSKAGIISVVTMLIAREGAEIAIFSFTGEYTLGSIAIGVATALAIAVLIYFSLIRVNLKILFKITLIYLILQAGFLLGYGIHEGLSVLKDIGKIPENSILLSKAFNLSDTVFNHKEGAVGVPLYVLLGWYSKPEWIQFIVQYIYTISIFGFWIRTKKCEELLTKRHKKGAANDK